ncbi:MAG: hypothetical protein IT372_14915 [Polyangiaceae bacterium]|nr:hypothetical protein [Polyangiaceae bacterium]
MRPRSSIFHLALAAALLVPVLLPLPARAAAPADGFGAPLGGPEPPPAAPPAAGPAPAAPTADAVQPDPAADPWGGARRPWLYAADPTAPAPGGVIAALGVGYAQVDRGAARPFAADVAHAGAVFDVSAEVGLARYASLHAQGLLAGEGAGEPVRAGVFAGASFFPLPAGFPVDLSLSGGYLRELGGSNGIWGRVGVAGDLGAARLSFTALGEHVLAEGRDGMDVLLTSGVSYRLGPARLGLEYVVQDLEGAWDPEEADGGIRHFIGPTAALELGRRVQIAAGPAFGLAQGSPDVLGRLAATYAF